MSKKEKKYTPEQERVLNSRGENLLVSASAGAGKTFIMIERIVELIEEGCDVSKMVVVTFTNLAAAQMKARLVDKLSKKTDNPLVVEQLENIESANICTLHSFCNELLRNYFYVVDVDPAFAILDDATTTTLKNNVLDDVFKAYFDKKDEDFRDVYKIFSSKRREENFRDILLRLYSFSRCLPNFNEWYLSTKDNFETYSETNPVIRAIRDDIAEVVKYYRDNFLRLADNSRDDGLTKIADALYYNADQLNDVNLTTLEDAARGLFGYKLKSMPNKGDEESMSDVEKQVRAQYGKFLEKLSDFKRNYAALFRFNKGETMGSLWKENQDSALYMDKLVEIINEFDKVYFEAKKQRGGVDYDDLEHLCLQILSDDAAREEIHSRYDMLFVDEYQDTNPIQEAIINALRTPDKLFMVGDIKQSIYGFRGCEPSIFTAKYNEYKAEKCDMGSEKCDMGSKNGRLEELNDNFRTNCDILDFVNQVFNRVMTPSFGKVDYEGTAQLKGIPQPSLSPCATRVDILTTKKCEERVIDSIYDIQNKVEKPDEMSQGELIARRIKEYVGKAYTVEIENELNEKIKVTKHIEYGDIVILTRGMKRSAVDIYNTLISHNIPVTANFREDGLATKEIKDLVNLLRVVDNPYVDVSLVGACLSFFGNFTEAELGIIRLDTEGRIPFYNRLQNYEKNSENGEMGWKIRQFLDLIERTRFYARSASVDEVALFILRETNYHLFVQGLPNGALRLKKLYAFIDGLKGVSYAQSIDKFLSFIDESENNRIEEGLSKSGAVTMMTMHASKGLEFPIVFVAGVETEFKFDYFAVEQNSQVGLATSHYDFKRMKKAKTLGFHGTRLINQKKQREEEMRLLYVALTRPQYLLNIVATCSEEDLKSFSTLPSRANSHFDWLLPTVMELRDTDKVKNLDINIPPIFENGDEKSTDDLVNDAEVDVAEIEKNLNYKYEYINETTLPTKLVSSALDKEYIASSEEPIAEVVLVNDADRNFVGTAYHKVFQYAPLDASVEKIQDVITTLVSNDIIKDEHAKFVDAQKVYDVLHETLRNLLDGGDVYHELPFMLSAPYSDLTGEIGYKDEVMLQGVIDLLIIKQDCAVVVDFKYTAHSDVIDEKYKWQLNSYKLAVERIMNINKVETYVLSIADKKLIKM